MFLCVIGISGEIIGRAMVKPNRTALRINGSGSSAVQGGASGKLSSQARTSSVGICALFISITVLKPKISYAQPSPNFRHSMRMLKGKLLENSPENLDVTAAGHLDDEYLSVPGRYPHFTVRRDDARLSDAQHNIDWWRTSEALKSRFRPIFNAFKWSRLTRQ